MTVTAPEFVGPTMPASVALKRKIAGLKPEWLKTPKCLQGSVGDTVVFQKSAELAEKGIAKFAEGAAEGSLKAGIASKATSLLGKMGAVSKKIPVIGVAISAALELPDVVEGFKEGRGAAQVMKSGSVVTGTTVGAVVGAALGSFIPGPGNIIGGIVGGIAGEWLGRKLGSGLFGSNKGTEQVAAAQQPSPQFGTMTGVAPFDLNSPLAGLPIA